MSDPGVTASETSTAASRRAASSTTATNQRLLGGGHAGRAVAHGKHSDPSLLADSVAICPEHGNRTHQREVSLAAAHLAESPAPVVALQRRQPDLDQQLFRGQRGDQRGDGELSGGRYLGAVAVRQHQFSVQRGADRGQFGRGIGVGQAATDSAPVAYLEMPDVRDGSSHHGEGVPDGIGTFQVPLAG